MSTLPAKPPRLLDQVRAVIRALHYSPRTEDAYVGWIRRYILFHDKRHPKDLGTAEVEKVLVAMAGAPRLVAGLLFGSGLRLQEAISLRVKDLDFQRGEITVRSGKGAKDRVTMLPGRLQPAMQQHLTQVRFGHDGDLAEGHGGRWDRTLEGVTWPWEDTIHHLTQHHNATIIPPQWRRPRCPQL